MDKFVLRLDKAKKAIDEADYIIIGAGAGLSTAAGIDYTGERFEKYFKDFIEEYGFTDMYSSGFYPFESQEEKWAYWARHVFANRYDVGKTGVYQKLLKLVEDKEYFVLTTNVEHQFWINGFDDERIFATQGDYGLLQCEKACHDRLYPNKEQVFEWVEKTEDFRIPSDLVPKCPVCGGDILVSPQAFNCSNYSNPQVKCKFMAWRNIAGHVITKQEMVEICEEGQTREPLELYKNNGAIFYKRLGLSTDKKSIIKI
jgi:NAD-dependent SIR2 family protein deacetylase